MDSGQSCATDQPDNNTLNSREEEGAKIGLR